MDLCGSITSMCISIHQRVKDIVLDVWMQRFDMATTGSTGLQSDPPPYQELGCQPKYFPPELVGTRDNAPQTLYSCYLIELNRYYYKRTQLQNIILALRTRLESDDENLSFELNIEGGNWVGQTVYIGDVGLSNEQILRCRRFQVTVLRVLFEHNLNTLDEALGRLNLVDGSAVIDYLLLPSSMDPSDVPKIDWNIISSVLFSYQKPEHRHSDSCSSRHGCRPMHTKNGLLFSCLLESSLVSTPHNGNLYCIVGIFDHLDGSSSLKMGRKGSITYKEYYKEKYVELCFETELLLNGKHIPKVQNYLSRGEARKARSDASVELPPELCEVIMSPVPISTFYSFSCLPSIMHRFESLLVASCFKRMFMDQCTRNVVVPTSTILEAITTNLCQEKDCMESLETLGDSFLKYATSQHLFKTYPNDQEGLLTAKRKGMISNSQLYKLAYNRKIPGFIRDEQFDPKTWVGPGDYSIDSKLDEECVLTSGKLYSRGRRKMDNETIADVTEALIGAFLSTAGEIAALSFLRWLGLDIDFIDAPIVGNFPLNAEQMVNVKRLESDSLLNYTFRDPSLLVEALTHGSYIPHGTQSYQRLEFLGDAVLDYAVTRHFYDQYPGLSPGCLTELRSESVNNACYALSSVKAGLHNYILHSSTALRSSIADFVKNIEQSSASSTFGWVLKTSFPWVLADIIESIAGAIYLDSGLRTDIVFEKIRPVLEPMVTPESLRLNPVKELTELCQKRKYRMKEPVVVHKDGEACTTIEVMANGGVRSCSSSARNRKTAKRLACERMLELLESETCS
ncbi:PREDICTED: endoribonuclease Dicer homolog 2-like isoform X2 [Ipomoea nil]|uniref:endoribonuclease Dicer homolog 2-like isoform X2 n=1 Tax=Ipomoea nil TaxID=35883 RepID=UPI00090124CA|nr:PREDICTED: endoribonuclease Dicer homolog 2-like isoform X2 [Ipomoea nil]